MIDPDLLNNGPKEEQLLYPPTVSGCRGSARTHTVWTPLMFTELEFLTHYSSRTKLQRPLRVLYVVFYLLKAH